MENLKVINSSNLFSNLAMFSGVKICAMVKSNAYGHGLAQIVKLSAPKVDMFGVVSVSEALAVRKVTDKPILICGRTSDFRTCKKFGFDVMIDDEENLKLCHRVADVGIHLKIDCGMNRFGVKSRFCARIINDYLEENQICLKSIATHFSDTSNRRKTVKQYQNFLKLRNEISQKTQICFGGSGVIDYPFKFDILRVGIGMYGYGRKGLLPVMSVKSFVCKTFYAHKGSFVGYANAHKVKRDGFYAIVPVGYGDGLKRNLSGKFCVKIRGEMFQAVGNICMDAFFVRVNASVKEGDTVEILWDANLLAEISKTIPYEILTGFSNLRGKTLTE